MRLPGTIGDALASTSSSLANLSLGKAPRHRVLVVGCAYGGVTAVVNLLDMERGKARQAIYPGADLGGRRCKGGLEVTVIDERDGYFHSVGAPLAHVAPKHTSLMWRRFSRLNELKQPNLHFKHGSVNTIDPSSKVATWLDRSGKVQQQTYDYLIMATGLKRHWPAVPKSGSYEEYLQDGKSFISKIVGGDPSSPQEGRRIVIIGAGAVGIEFAGEIKNYYPGIKVTLIHSRSQVLSSEPLPSEIKEQVGIMLAEEGVDVILGNRASITELPSGEFSVKLANGTTLTADFVIDSTKKGSPTTGILPPECLNNEGEIVVNQDLTFKNAIANREAHFGVGDVIAWTGIKRAGSAMVMGQAAAQNVFVSILNAEEAESSTSSAPLPFTELPSWPAVIGIAVGKQCLTYDKGNGMKHGVEVMQGYFQDDLGWSSNLRYLGLTDVTEEVEERKMKAPEKVDIGEVGVEAVSVAA
ncbi:FAD/NAD(P)-binding domain-containing protein [Massarina eburnea CBS 473.64]|uniref:FAD/NAD(P)-binding domain-containing protein n=1 Tax=Massarina eburnea CBS 473.64 TaxID=1395130 RepID=A0A6A6RJ22_9PLEO|nr:FAD/NAD(P)-binding domain-containing protein [Massarina eburnea CBS 473.64]